MTVASASPTPPPASGPVAPAWRGEAGRVAGAFAAMIAGLVLEMAAGRGVAVPQALIWGAWGTSYVLGGWDGAQAGLAAIRAGRADIDLLMILAALGALAIGAPFEGAMLLFLFSLSNLLQHLALGRSRSAIRALMALRPDVARVRRDGRLVEVGVEDVAVGEVYEARPGDRLPLDGVVLDGRSAVDQASLTGESVPVEKGPGDSVFAGTVCDGGSIEVEVTALAGQSAIARVVALVEQAQSEKAETQRLIDRFEQPYAWGVIGLTLFAIVLPWLLLGDPFRPTFYRAMTLMVAASPCALVISTPAAVLSAIAAAARRGVLFKGGVHVEALGAVQAVVFDKTGTLTAGAHRLGDVVALDGMPEEEILALAAAVQVKSEHHLAEATVEAARSRALAVPEVDAFQAVVGRGVTGHVDGREVAVGNARLLADRGVAGWPEAEATVARLEAEGKTAVVVAQADAAGRLGARGVLAFADTLRPGAAEAVAALRREGVRHVALVTGDNAAVAQAVADAVGVDTVEAAALPERKVEIVRDLTETVGPVAMVGDGVNDAPGLAAASVGIAMGAAGTDAALETADVVLMGDDLDALAWAVGLSRRARRTLAVNLGVSLLAIAVMVVLILTVGLPLPVSVVGHEGSTVLVSLNGLRLLAEGRS